MRKGECTKIQSSCSSPLDHSFQRIDSVQRKQPNIMQWTQTPNNQEQLAASLKGRLTSRLHSGSYDPASKLGEIIPTKDRQTGP